MTYDLGQIPYQPLKKVYRPLKKIQVLYQLLKNSNFFISSYSYFSFLIHSLSSNLRLNGIK
jgi:hypothetical protein